MTRTETSRESAVRPEPSAAVREHPPPGRPDLTRPRGGQDVERIDVDRGEGKLERVLGW